MAENPLNLVECINLQVQEIESNPNSINSKKLKALIIKFLKPKDKVNILKAVTDKNSLDVGNYPNGSEFLIRNHGEQKEVNIFQELKEMSTPNYIPSESVL